MLLEEYVADRVRASEQAAHTRELELLRVIRAEEEPRQAEDEPRRGGWLARRRAARVEAKVQAQARDAVAGVVAGGTVRADGAGVAAEPTGQTRTVADSAPVAATPPTAPTTPTTPTPSTRPTRPTTPTAPTAAGVRSQAEREFQHAGR